jgi:CBS domain-containing protein
MRVQELMTHPVVTCHVRDSANAAAQIMWEHDCGVVPVVDDDGRLAGIVTDRDICLAAFFQGQPLSAIPLHSMMSRELCTCRPEDDVAEAERMMSTRQLRRIVAVNERGAPAGILSLGDVARRVGHGSVAKQRDGQELLSTVAAVSMPHGQRSGNGNGRAMER